MIWRSVGFKLLIEVPCFFSFDMQELTFINLASIHLASRSTIVGTEKCMISKTDEFNTKTRLLANKLELEGEVDQRKGIESRTWMLEVEFKE